MCVAIQKNYGGVKITLQQRQQQTPRTIIIPRQHSFRILGLIYTFARVFDSFSSNRHHLVQFEIYLKFLIPSAQLIQIKSDNPIDA